MVKQEPQESESTSVDIPNEPGDNPAFSLEEDVRRGSSEFPPTHTRPPPPPESSSDETSLRTSGEFFSSSSSTSSFSVKRYLRRRLPILKWAPEYRIKRDLLPDVISGMTVGLTAIPQSMAYANVAGLTPEYGLYSSFISCFVYLLLGSCRQMTIGPTSLMALLVFETCGEDFPSCVVLVGFWVGVTQLVMGLLKLGAVVSLISDPVTIGFVAGASFTTSSSQLRSFFGLSGPGGNGFIAYCKAAIANIGTIKVGDTCLGVACVILLLLFKNLKDYVKPSTKSRSGQFIENFLWYLSIGRNAIVVISASVLAASLSDPPFALTGTVKSGLPPVAPPDFVLPASHFYPRNETIDGNLSFWETWDELRTAPLMIAIISILQNVAIGKAFGSGQSIDATQEMIALGISHICASFFTSMPTAGSFTRSAVNEASGVKSPVGGIFTGVLVIFALSFLTRWFAYIPKSTLAAVIFCAVIPMIEYESILPMWRVSKLDVITTAVTFLASLLFGMEYGIIIGVGVSLAFYMIRHVRPRMTWSIEMIGDANSNTIVGNPGELSSTKSYILVSPEQGFMFPSVDAIRTTINKLALRHPDIKMIVLDCRNMISMDFTAAGALCSLVKALKKTGKSLVFVRCQEDWVNMMRAVGLQDPQCYGSFDEVNKNAML